MANAIPIAPLQRRHYRAALETLARNSIDFLVGGGFALYFHLGQWRATKDLDLFIRRQELEPALEALSREGFACELTDERWLGKARRGGALTDLIFCSYNGLFPVDDEWFAAARTGELFGVPVRLVAPEEIIVSKAFVAARDRFDGSDIAWLLRTFGADLDWDRIERAFGEEHWPILLWQLVHFSYVFPDDIDVLPSSLWRRLWIRWVERLEQGPRGIERSFGSMLDPLSYRTSLGRGRAGKRLVT